MKLRRGLVALVAAAGLAAAAGAPAHSREAPSQLGTSRAVVNINGANHVIHFSGSISGLTALRQVASVETRNYGGSLGEAVCKINGVGDPPDACPGGWRYFRAVGGAGGWTYSGAGPSNTTVRDGDVEGWGYNRTPPFSSFCSVAGCAPPPPPPPPAPPPPPPAGGAPGSAGAPGDPAGGAGTSGAGTSTTTTEKKATGSTGEDGRGDEGDSNGRGEQGAGDGSDGDDPREVATDLAADSRPGSGGPPASLLVFAVLLAGLVAGALIHRRIRRRGRAESAESA